MDRILKAARASGSLNLSNRSLREVPPEVYKLLETVGPDEKWWEVVELQKLLLAHNDITKLPDDLGRISSLTFLNVSANQLTDFPSAVSELTALKVLDISNNKLSELPPEICSVTSLARLHVANNRLVSLPHAIGNWKYLTHLKASNNLMSVIPEDLSLCSRVIELDIEGNKITQLPDGLFSSLLNLTELKGAKNALKDIPRSVGSLKKLGRLELHQNRISTIPPSLGGCTGLLELSLGENLITCLPPEVGSLTKLSTFDLHANQLKELPVELCSLQLSVLDLSNNNLAGVPAALGNMTSLRKLVLTGNPVRALRSSLISGPTPALLKFLRSRLQEDAAGTDVSASSSGNIFGAQLPEQVLQATRQAASTKALSLSGKGLTSVPPLSLDSGSFTSLDLSKNQLQELPKELSQYTLLEALLVGDNKIVEWPGDVLASFPYLQQLVLARNPLRQLPRGAFASLENLKILDLSGVLGSASDLPPLSSMPLLQELRLSRVQLQEFPEDIAQLGRLNLLDLSDNLISTVPETITVLTLLEELNLANNSISVLNPKLGLLEPTLRSLKLDGNPIRSIRRPILERGTKSVLQYLRNKL